MIFQISSRFRFCLLSLRGGNLNIDQIPMSFYSFYPSEIQKILEELFIYKKNIKLPFKSKLILFEPNDFKLFNPNSFTAPIFSYQKDYLITKSIYEKTNVLIKRNQENGNIETNVWDIYFKRMFDMSTDSKLFYSKDDLNNLNAKNLSSLGWIWKDKKNNEYFPLYEGKMIWLYNHRYNSVIISKTGYQHAPSKVTISEYNNSNYAAIPYYWVKKEILFDRIPKDYKYDWFLVFRKISNASDKRTFISTIIPKVGAVDSLPIIFSSISPKLICCLLANLNSIVIDYVVKQKLSGWNLNYYILEQLPIFPPTKYSKDLIDEIVKRVIELTYTSNHLESFAKDCNCIIGPFKWNLEKRAKLQAELDAIFFLLYKIEKNDIEYILNVLNVLKEHDLNKFTEYKTKRLILKAYDKFSKQKELFE